MTLKQAKALRQMTCAGWFRPMRALTRTMRKGKWELRKAELRTRDPRFAERLLCPLTFAAMAETGQRHSNRDYLLASNAIGIPNRLAFEIVTAADNNDFACERMRRILVRAAGLSQDQTLTQPQDESEIPLELVSEVH
jgi:hypothetical protein